MLQPPARHPPRADAEIRPARGAALRWPHALRFAGPGLLVAAGYMDPGNWATSLAAGSRFGLALLGVVVFASLVAMLFQAAAVRLGLGLDMDLAQACRAHFPRPVTVLLWLLCELAIVACNVAELLGTAIALQMLFDIPLRYAVVVAAADVAAILALQHFGYRYLEAFVIALVLVVGACFALQLSWLDLAAPQAWAAALPTRQWLQDPQMLYIAVGIVGATVMPHNLYLHSSIVQQRLRDRSTAGRREAIRLATWDSSIALLFAMAVSASILMVAAFVFHQPGQRPVGELSEAYRLLSPVLGVAIASAVFGAALLASGLASSVTGVMAGQIVMEGFLRLRWSAATRALLTRLLAIGPAALAIVWYGESGANALLVASQVVLSLQLPFAIGPLLWVVTSRRRLGEHAFGRPAAALLWSCAAGIVALNVWMLTLTLGS